MLIPIVFDVNMQLTYLHHHPHAKHVQHSHFLPIEGLFRIFFCLVSRIQPTNLQ